MLCPQVITCQSATAFGGVRRVIVARPLLEIQNSKGDIGEGKEEGKEKWVALTAVREVGYRVLILSLIRSLCKSQQSQEMSGPWLRLIATAITKEGFL